MEILIKMGLSAFNILNSFERIYQTVRAFLSNCLGVSIKRHRYFYQTLLVQNSCTFLTPYIYNRGGNRITSPAASVVPGGFEPPLTEPKTVVLPLHHKTIVVPKRGAPRLKRCKVTHNSPFPQNFFRKIHGSFLVLIVFY